MEVAAKNSLLVCTQLECETTEEMQASIEQAKVEGADLVELCIDSMEFSHISEVDKLIQHPTLPAIVSYRYLESPSFFFFFFISFLYPHFPLWSSYSHLVKGIIKLSRL